MRSQQQDAGDLRTRIAAANEAGFARLFALRGEWLQAGSDPRNDDGLALLQLGVESFLPWCRDKEGDNDASRLTATFAYRYGERILVQGGDPRQVIATLEEVWPYRRQAAYRACQLALTLADALRLDARFEEAEQALDFCDTITNGPTWKKWRPIEQLMVPIHRLQLECRRAALELSLGNPDGMLPHLARAQGILRSPRKTPPADMPSWLVDVVDSAWASAAALLRKEEVECYVGMEHFETAVAAAREAVTAAKIVGDPADLHLAEFYLAMARAWASADSGTEAEQASALIDLEPFAVDGSPVRQRTLLALVELGAIADDVTAAARHTKALRSGSHGDGPRVTTAQTGLLLAQDSSEPVARQRLREQKDRQRAAFDQMLHSWNATPRRDSGVGFLHFWFRRETIGQLVAITLRAGRDVGEDPPEAAIAEALKYVMLTQMHSTLAQRLKTKPLSTAALQALLQPNEQGVLLFLPTRGQTHVFAVSAERIGHHALPHGAGSIRADIQDFVSRLQLATSELRPSPAKAKEHATALRSAGATVRDTLMPAPLLRQLREWRSVTVIGSELLHGPIAGSSEAGYLNYLPIECLPWRGAELFGQRFAIDHNVSLPVWARLSEGATGFDEESSLDVFGVLNEGGRGIAPRDALSRQSMAALRKSFPLYAQQLDGDCTLASVTRRGRPADGRRDGIAVFLAHGGYDASSARGSFLQLADRRLDCPGVQRLGATDAPFAQLVVLAACRAAKAPTRAGDSLANLGGAFQLAGAKAVVQSRFDLPLRRTETLLRDFLERLAKGATTAEAMRAARTSGDAQDALDAFRTGVLQVHGFGQAQRQR